MSKMIVKIENKSTQGTFFLAGEFKTDGTKETPFTFGNSTNRMERVSLIIQDPNAHEVKPVEVAMSIPKEKEKINTSISRSKSYVYEMKGKITDSGVNVLLELPAITYLLKKGAPYSFYIQHDQSKSNEVRITF